MSMLPKELLPFRSRCRIMTLKRKEHLFRVCDAFRMDYPENSELSRDHLEKIATYYGISCWDKDTRELREAIADELDMDEEDVRHTRSYYTFEDSGLEKLWKDRTDKNWTT